MVLLAGINMDGAQLAKLALQSFYGIGPSVSQKLLARNYIHPLAKLSSLQDKQLESLNNALASMKIENDLRREIRGNIARLRDLGTYRGRRHAMGLPVRGQRTRCQNSSATKLNKVDRRG
ncbi:ribosomal protein S13 [Pseudovirgaria hyperparasitica]|uniref:Ribosomal protein S13 n=1 Tax=Pseudovirgaria hyperparasitica TaxID=470096 RepID=A0A6A6W665_9PEZI|nr:ribosomal protein S13 [Pseudovirgaria hyperparasitica]KAF2757047.1 ribosomal protein S13 [Pseudovirgaria hyperparasitica]